MATLFIVGILLTGMAVLASGEAVPRYLVSSGGGQISGSSLVLHNAVGQPVVGAVSEEAVTLCSGYWCGAAAPPIEIFTPTIYLPFIQKP